MWNSHGTISCYYFNDMKTASTLVSWASLLQDKVKLYQKIVFIVTGISIAVWFVALMSAQALCYAKPSSD